MNEYYQLAALYYNRFHATYTQQQRKGQGMSTARPLLVRINHATVGTLSTQDDIWRFAYAPEWVASPQAFALTPGLPLSEKEYVDGASQRPVQWYFDKISKAHRASGVALCTTAEGKPKRPGCRVFGFTSASNTWFLSRSFHTESKQFLPRRR